MRVIDHELDLTFGKVEFVIAIREHSKLATAISQYAHHNSGKDRDFKHMRTEYTASASASGSLTLVICKVRDCMRYDGFEMVW